MAYVFIQLLINLLLVWHGIDGTVINCTVYSSILQQVPNRIVGTIAIANSSNEEIFWDHVNFEAGVQFPLKFMVVTTNYDIISGSYILQLHIYQLPRGEYDLPLWSADSIDHLIRSEKPNSVIFQAHNDRKPMAPFVMGIILASQQQNTSLLASNLTVKVGAMPSITLFIHNSDFPILFMVTDIPTAQIRNSTLVTILISGPQTNTTYEAKERAVFAGNYECTTLLFTASQARSTYLTVIMSAHVFTSISLFSLGATYRIYRDEYLLFEQSAVIGILEFPFIIHKELIPISTAGNYSIEATIFGPMPGYATSLTLFEGVTYTRLVPGINNSVKISMLYTGPKIGTTIIGTVRQKPLNLSTWPLAGSNLAFAIEDESTDLAESRQFIIFDQTFPIQFTLLNLKSINQSHQDVAFTVTITYLDGTAIWGGVTQNNRIIFEQLNKFDIGLSVADGYGCQSPGQGYCDRSSTVAINKTCCSQYKCSNGQCRLS